ncbi:MAG: hypothetical protein DHS20C17_24720 [Cyclobacteriaceae bacterium]|nr:MAG: hypothetical protein DHS20C17_24720 [Cyclobacteriaceae bacterium]
MKALLYSCFFSILFSTVYSQSIPLPEHPNPIKKRDQWVNLNGQWDFAFDPTDNGLSERWQENGSFNQQITVPFPWGSRLSGVTDDADIGWYKRTLQVPADWQGKRVFLIIGASDWETKVWLDGKLLGSHQGGYVPFEFEVTEYLKYDQDMSLVVRADDARRPHTLYGKQGYGNARGIWQTVYLESRGKEYVEDIHFTPDIDKEQVEVTAYLPQPVPIGDEKRVKVSIQTDDGAISTTIIFKEGQTKASSTVDIPNQRLWSLDDPHLYEASAIFGEDVLYTYFGMRKIGVVNLPGTDIPYISLNNEPIYLQLALDQSYHPDGYYTFPNDQFMIDEINRSKSIGLNGIRTHIKVEIPRKLYWADKLGLLVMEDLPNSWGEPEEQMQLESTYTLREMIKRDYNHPSIFSWVIINETWGMITTTERGKQYLPESQKWLVSMYHLAKSLDPSRLVEDNSICCGRGHTVTDINSWHAYLPGYEWDNYLTNLSDSTFVGSEFNYEDGYVQGSEPNINSECGNVWGYEGSTGDVDWSWDYHRMINSFRTHPKVAGWLYTEHHDVINEWNGYWRFDRTEKYTGLDEIVPDMSLLDLHSSVYISTGQNISYTVNPGDQLEIPLFLSVMSSKVYQGVTLEYQLNITNTIGETTATDFSGSININYQPWMQRWLDPLMVEAPEMNGLATLQLILKSSSGKILHRNFVHLVIEGGKEPDDVEFTSVRAKDYSNSQWSKKSWVVLDGLKVNGAGNGYFEYTLDIGNLDLANSDEVYFIVEASAKELFVKDQEAYNSDQDFMTGSRVAPSSNPNSYPMTDETEFPSTLRILINGQAISEQTLPDDPADHRGVLSWHAQPQDRKLREAGSYGYLIKVPLDTATRQRVAQDGTLKVRLETTGDGGLAIYGKNFGRYPLDPSLVVK